MDALRKIKEIRYGDHFNLYKNKFFMQEGADSLDDEKKKKLFIDIEIMNKVIEMFTSFCPDLHPSIPKGRKKDKKHKLIIESLSSIHWGSLNNIIYDLQETDGDVFYYIYFDEKDINERKGTQNKKIFPKLKKLEADKMERTILDEAGNPRAYIYRHDIFDEKINYLTGETTKENEREEILIFEKGQCHKIVNRKDEKGQLVLDEDGKVVISKTTIKNKEGLEDVIPLIHIYSDKRQGEEFSIIPADSYVDLCLTIDQIVSDMRAINRNSGFPKQILLDCVYTAGDGQIGGARLAETIRKEGEEFDNTSPRQGQIIDCQIKNGLDSYFSELKFHIDNLYDMVGITNPTLMQRVSSSDSSKMYNQVNMRMEQKIERYIDNIIEGFKPFFKILLIMNDMYVESEDFGYSFSKPQSIIKNSAYDELLIKQLELNTGIKTLYDMLKEKNYTDDEINIHFDRINEEVRNGKNDISVHKQSKIKSEGGEI